MLASEAEPHAVAHQFSVRDDEDRSILVGLKASPIFGSTRIRNIHGTQNVKLRTDTNRGGCGARFINVLEGLDSAENGY